MSNLGDQKILSTGANRVAYDDGIVRKFFYVTVLWGAVAFLVGLIVALQLSSWKFNFGLQWLTFGRLRPLHTNFCVCR